MCFQKSSNDDKVKIAAVDITCYKYLDIRGSNLVSPYYFFLWTPDVLHRSDIGGMFIDYGEIDRGFHSSKSLEDCVEYRRWQHSENYRIYEFVIPKGSEYYENSTQYISNQIILKSATPVEEATNQ